MDTARLVHWIARKRGLLVGIPLVGTMLCFWGETERAAVIWPVGTMLVAAGFCVRVWAQRYIHWHVTGPGILATSGPYALVRNPLYVGNLLLVTGATVLSELVWMIPLMAAWWMAVHSITVRSEESRCTEKFGEPYRQYMAAVPRWFPRLHRRAATGSGAGDVWGPLWKESRCLLIILPYVLKEIVSGWLLF